MYRIYGHCNQYPEAYVEPKCQWALWGGGKDDQKVIRCYLWLLSHNIFTHKMIYLQFWKKIYVETMIKREHKTQNSVSKSGVYLWAIGKCAVFTSADCHRLYFIVICHVAYINRSVCYFPTRTQVQLIGCPLARRETVKTTLLQNHLNDRLSRNYFSENGFR